MKKLLLLTTVLCSFFVIRVAAQTPEALFLDMQKINLGTMNVGDEKKQYITSIQSDKQRIQDHMLKGVYENANALYKKGDHARAHELAERILAIDPSNQDARNLLQKTQNTSKGGGPLSKEVLSDKFQQGLALYRQGHNLEASQKFEEVLASAPKNVRARYWLEKSYDKLFEEYDEKGDRAFIDGNYQLALNQWYSALLVKGDNDFIVSKIRQTEDKVKTDAVQHFLQQGLAQTRSGQLERAYASYNKALEIRPNDDNIRDMERNVKNKIASGYMDSGKDSYYAAKYDTAIAQWKKASQWGYDKKYVNSLISRANEQKQAELRARQEREEQMRREAEEAANRERELREEERRRRKLEELQGEDLGSLMQTDGSGVSEENKRAADKKHTAALAHFQNNDYERARTEWTIARQLDPTNPDVEEGLKRLDELQNR